MAYTEVFYPKLPMEGCADQIGRASCRERVYSRV